MVYSLTRVIAHPKSAASARAGVCADTCLCVSHPLPAAVDANSLNSAFDFGLLRGACLFVLGSGRWGFFAERMAFLSRGLHTGPLRPLRKPPYPAALAFLLGVPAVIAPLAVMYETRVRLILRVIKMHMSHHTGIMLAAALDNESCRAQELIADALKLAQSAPGCYVCRASIKAALLPKLIA